MCNSLNSTLRTVGTSRQLSDSEQHSLIQVHLVASPPVQRETRGPQRGYRLMGFGPTASAAATLRSR